MRWLSGRTVWCELRGLEMVGVTSTDHLSGGGIGFYVACFSVLVVELVPYLPMTKWNGRIRGYRSRVEAQPSRTGGKQAAFVGNELGETSGDGRSGCRAAGEHT